VLGVDGGGAVSCVYGDGVRAVVNPSAGRGGIVGIVGCVTEWARRKKLIQAEEMLEVEENVRVCSHRRNIHPTSVSWPTTAGG
jgi:hypothetical protein